MNLDMYKDALLEIAFSISGEFNLKKMLQNTLPIFLRKLNCTLAAVIQKNNGNLHTEYILPKTMAEHTDYLGPMEELSLALETDAGLSWYPMDHGSYHYYAFPLEDFGFLLLARARPFNIYFLKEMSPLTRMLTRTCLACTALEKRKVSEAQLLAQKAHFESIFTNTNDAMVYFDTEHRLFNVNERFTQMFGYTLDEVWGRNVNTIVDPLKREKEYGSPRILAGETIEMEAIRYAKNGNGIEVLLKGGPVLINGVIAGGYAIYSDISERKKNERKLLESNLLLEKSIDRANKLARQAEMANIAKSAFLANMSHEIRTPMNAIMGLTELCMAEPLTEKQQDYLLKVSQASRSLLGIINDILDFSKIEAGKLSMEKIPFIVDDVLHQSWNMVAHRARQKKLELICYRDPAIPEQLLGDPLRLGQVLTNLVGNAIKFTESGSVMVTVTLIRQEKKSFILEFCVKDTGMGISDDEKKQLFQPFSQADNSTTRKFGGTGLGLTISRQLVELMGGEIRLESTPQKGSSFIFTCSLQADHHIRETGHKLPEEIMGMRVLVLGGHRDTGKILKSYLQAFFLETRYTENTEEAKKLLEDAIPSYDIVFWDNNTFVPSETETIKQILKKSENRKKPAIIIVSDEDDDHAASPKDREYAAAWLAKPFTPSLVMKALLKSLKKPKIRSPVKQRQQLSNGRSLKPLHGKRILLVEDHEINRLVATELMKQVGIETETAFNGKEAIRILDLNPYDYYDCVLMDIQMPVMDGYKTAREIRKNPIFKDLPILAMTANAMDEDRKKAIENGMQGHVAKPIIPEELFAKLLEFCRNKAVSGIESARKWSHEPGLTPEEEADKNYFNFIKSSEYTEDQKIKEQNQEKICPEPPPMEMESNPEFIQQIKNLNDLLLQYDGRAEEHINSLLATRLHPSSTELLNLIKKRIWTYDFEGAVCLMKPYIHNLEEE
ncbi:PAS domain-containing hybrid sensor histidine kinase/response regulator [Desulfobotulus mexicanus]|uniref:Sensory/regulatory protein RpfC n=1 Tax=Desulfobotulus mexicanus TaxID=2586642 RepID=A0A5S5MDY3_9BACT|nr:response regulator [Desulfobotulus mexicanus]TYT73835.1 response regulator [Desulfobotulus mexicanus]